eukprot:TRINITY_DN5164_c0_g4_i1.p2 TRINITY_DN5164_c0_g4~~TRINITY_DN5164_c0_g4_i1.p2  ORF type:complete len:130 (+),score=29.58 TRINITY_DN5164_c0_g4_i1:47-391(+)
MDDEFGDSYEEEMPVVPDNMRRLRACKNCALLKSVNQWDEAGCTNCDRGAYSSSNITSEFSGLVSFMRPNESWVARYLNHANQVPGCYAMEVNLRQDLNTRDEIDDIDMQMDGL